MQVLTTASTPLSLSRFPHRFDNTLPPHELHLAVAQGAVVARADGPTRPRCAVRARGDGSIDVTVMANLSGDYRLHIWVNGAQVPACPYPLRVFANRALLRDAAEAARELMAADGDGSGPRSPRRSGDGAVVGAIGASRPNVPHAHDSAIRIQKGSFGRGAQSKLGNLESPRRDSPRTALPRGGHSPRSSPTTAPRSPQSVTDLYETIAPHQPVFTPRTTRDPQFITAGEAPYEGPMPTTAPASSYHTSHRAHDGAALATARPVPSSAAASSAAYLARLARAAATPRARDAARAVSAGRRDERHGSKGLGAHHGAVVTTVSSSPQFGSETASSSRRKAGAVMSATPRTSTLRARARSLLHRSSSTGEIYPSSYPSSYPSADWANQFGGVSVGQAAVRQGLHGGAPSPRTYGELIARRGGPTSPRALCRQSAVTSATGPRGGPTSPRASPLRSAAVA
jgi:hypothetical protein